MNSRIIIALILPFLARTALAGSFTPLTFPGSSQVVATGINDAGTAVGWFTEPGRIRSFIRDAGGSVMVYQRPEVDETQTWKINNAGDMAGFVNGGGPSGFLLKSGGIYVPISVPGADFTHVYGLNDSDALVGTYLSPIDDREHGFIRTPEGTYRTFSQPETSYTQAFDMNNAGDVVGFSIDFGRNVDLGYVRRANGDFRSIHFPQAEFTRPLGINDLGQIVGAYSGAGGYHGFFRDRDGTYTGFDLPGRYTEALKLNNQGQIVGDYGPGSSIQGFLLNVADLSQYPVINHDSPPNTAPEPATLVAALTGMLALCVARGGRRR